MKELLQQIIELFSNNESFYLSSSYNEQECRLEFIDKLLESFGWDVKNNKCLPPYKKEVLVEKYEPNMKRPDYSMTFHGYTKFFVEAKKPSVDINTDSAPAIQARKYGWNAKHPIVVLTNFSDLYIYDCSCRPNNSDDVNVALIKKYHYSDYLDKYDEILSYLGREEVYSGNFDKKASENIYSTSHTSIRVDDMFLKDINQWRIELANDLFKNGKPAYQNLTYLNDCIQHFLNKMIFLRICEDRNLSTYQTLINTTGDESKLKNELNRLFKKSDSQYNSGLFSDPTIIFDLDNEIIINIIKNLYYPESPYLFNIIEPNILGNIYELFLTEKLSINNDGDIVLTKKDDCLNRSVVTTPIEIVRSIVKKTIQAENQFNDLDSIYKYKVIDIACGSGVFLEEAFAELSNAALKICQENGIEVDYTANGEKKLKYEIKKKILINCIFGVDIDPQAVEVCKFSLLIKILENETDISLAGFNPILPPLNSNIKCGNSLVENNDLPNGLDIIAKIKVNPFDWNTINGGDCFNCVIGNPPYVKTEDMHTLLSDAEFNVYTNKYATSFKQFDKYYLFIEKGIQLLTDNGSFGMIVPNKFMKIDTAKNLRHLLRNDNFKLSIIDFGDAQLFEDKTIYSSLLFVNKDGDGNVTYYTCDGYPSLMAEQFRINMNKSLSDMNDDVWSFSEKFDNTQNDAFDDLTHLFEVLNGIQTSMENPHVYWIGDNQITSETDTLLYFNFMGNQYCVEKSILKPYFKPINNDEKGGGTFDLIATNKKIIYPYDDEGHLFDIQTMQTTYPNCWDYLCRHYDILVPKQVSPNGRRDVPNATADTWYQYGRTQNLTAFNNSKKIIVKNMFSRPMFAIDDSNMILSSGGTAGYSAIKRKPDTVLSLEFIQAWLNADYTVEILKDIASQFEGGFYAIGTSKLKKIRIPNLNLDNPEDLCLYNSVNKNVSEINSLMKKLKSLSRQHEIELVKKENEKLIEEINKIVSDYYERHRN